MRNCGREIIAALVAVHGESSRQSCEDLLADLLLRYTNEALSDSVQRVCRDPLRKLAGGARFLGAAALCIEHTVNCPNLFAAIAAACRYQVEEDDVGSKEWTELQAAGPYHLLSVLSKLAQDDPLMLAFKQYFKDI